MPIVGEFSMGISVKASKGKYVKITDEQSLPHIKKDPEYFIRDKGLDNMTKKSTEKQIL